MFVTRDASGGNKATFSADAGADAGAGAGADADAARARLGGAS